MDETAAHSGCPLSLFAAWTYISIGRPRVLGPSHFSAVLQWTSYNSWPSLTGAIDENILMNQKEQIDQS